jgi:hypothetical protein
MGASHFFRKAGVAARDWLGTAHDGTFCVWRRIYLLFVGGTGKRFRRLLARSSENIVHLQNEPKAVRENVSC